jgi:hypothetical protein
MPFSCRYTKNGRVQVRWRGRIVTTLAGAAASRFVDKFRGLDVMHQQLLLAKTTGQFKFGNERMAKEKGKGQ